MTIFFLNHLFFHIPNDFYLGQRLTGQDSRLVSVLLLKQTLLQGVVPFIQTVLKAVWINDFTCSNRNHSLVKHVSLQGYRNRFPVFFGNFGGLCHLK